MKQIVKLRKKAEQTNRLPRVKLKQKTADAELKLKNSKELDIKMGALSTMYEENCRRLQQVKFLLLSFDRES